VYSDGVASNGFASHPLHGSYLLMPFLIGTDEAGYGPNLGPLTVTATVWEIADGVDAVTLYKHCRKHAPAKMERAAKHRVVWADSKEVYKSGNGLDQLERGVLAALGLIGRTPRQWCELWNWLDPLCAPRIDELPWHMGYAADVPLWADAEEVAELIELLKTGLE